MIPISLKQEPATFDERCRKRGQAWLAENPEYDRPYDYWSEFEPNLRTAFNDKCGWCAMVIMRGQVDHFVPVAELKKANKHKLCYEWSNFRYIDGWINQKKLSAEVLDPFVVQAGWFEISLPSLQLIATNNIPRKFKDLADFTLKRLGLRDHETIVRYRQKWFSEYRKGALDLEGLREIAPQIAEAVDREIATTGNDWKY